MCSKAFLATGGMRVHCVRARHLLQPTTACNTQQPCSATFRAEHVELVPDISCLQPAVTCIGQAKCTHLAHMLQMLPVQEGKMVLRLFRILFEMLSKLPPPRPEEQQPLEVVLAPRFTSLVDTLLKQMIDAEVSPFADN